MNHINFDDLKGQICVLTGGAGIIGTSIAEALASNGIKTAILDLNEKEAKELALKIESNTGTKTRAYQANVLDKTSLLEAKKKINAELGKINSTQAGWRRVIGAAIANGIPVPALSTALSYYDGYRSERLPANLLQAQRDYFGAHTYERVDKPRGEFFHTNWTGRGGDISSPTYNV